MRLRAALLALVVPAVAGCDVAAMGPTDRENVSQTRRLDAQGTFTLENTNGAVIVEAWDQPTVSIEAEKVGPEGQLDQIQIEIRGEGDRVDVVTRHPRRRWGRTGSVEYHVKVPAQARVEVETTNGSVRVTGTGGTLKATTTNGGVEITGAAGEVEAETTNGSIRTDFRRAPAGGWHRFTTTNGAVSLTLPGDVSGRFEASTVNGGISTDFPLQVSGRVGGRRLRGQLGGGSARFDVRTVNGSVKIRKRQITAGT
jgi:hypothetical protein